MIKFILVLQLCYSGGQCFTPMTKTDFVFEVSGTKIAIVHFTWHPAGDGEHPSTMFFIIIFSYSL